MSKEAEHFDSKESEKALSENSDASIVSSDDDDDDDDDDELQRQKMQPRGRRGTVMAAPFKVAADWKPPVYDKSAEDKEAIKDSITEIFLFSTLDEDSLEIVVRAMKRVRFKAGDNIITQGDAVGDQFYVIETGICTIYVSGKKVMEIEGGTSDRNYFGELALLYDSPRAATVTATSDEVAGWSLDRLTFKKILMDATIKKRMLYKNFLEEVPILSTLTKNERLTVADSLRAKMFREGGVIIKEGEAGDEFYIIEDGEVKCTREDCDDEVSKRLGSGDYFGELALVTDDVRKATVTATRDTKVLIMDRGTFKRLLGPLESLLRDNVELYDKYVTRKK